MTTGSAHDLSRSILETALNSDPSAFQIIVRALAQSGKVKELQFLLGGGLLQTNTWGRNEKIANAILPVLDACPSTDAGDAQRLVADWQKAFGVVDAEQLSTALRHSDDPVLVRAMLRQGADPLWSDGWEQTSLYFAYEAKRTTVLATLLAHCLERDQVPQFDAPGLRLAPGSDSLLKRLLSTKPSLSDMVSNKAIVEVFEATPLGPRVKAALRVSLLDESRGTTFEPEARSGTKQDIAGIAFRLAALAGFDAEQWLAFFGTSARRGAVAAALADQAEFANEAVSIFQQAVGSGIEVDDIKTDAGQAKSGELTPLQRAARSDNVIVVRALLELGADPTLTSSLKNREVSAQSLAPKGSASAQVIAAWKARAAMRTQERQRPAAGNDTLPA